MDDTIGIKLPTGMVSAKCVSIVRRHTPLSISEIREAAESDDYIMVFDGALEEGPRKIVALYDELHANGIQARAFDFDESCDIEIIRNMTELYRDIYGSDE